jgi:hypothetical protein
MVFKEALPFDKLMERIAELQERFHKMWNGNIRNFYKKADN